MKKLILFSLVLFSLFSCSRGPLGAEEDMQNPSVAASSGSQIDVSDLEALGQAHNQALDLVAAHSAFPNISSQQCYETITDFGPQVFGSGYVATPLEDIESSIASLESFKEMADGWLAAGKISAAAQSRFYELEDLILDNLEMNKQADLQAGLQAFEGAVNAQAGLTVHEKTHLIGTSILTRHSGAYWHAAASNSSHPWHPVVMAKAASGPVGLPPSFTARYAANESSSGIPGLFPIPWPLLYDLIVFAEYAGQCEHPDPNATHICLSLIWTASAKASAEL